MDFFEIIISPFIFIIKQLFEFSYGLTDNYGAAIILLSFFISALLLPVFIFIEKAKKKDDIVKRKMQPLVDEIKRVYKGQERYYYLKTLNRQYNYSPFKALVPILSLLIQIPFFIAAYQYLEHLEALQGVNFWLIDDLSIADGLLGGINFLPIAMTLVNLLTAYFYTKNGNKTELKQMLVVAIVFLILLYSLPAALLLYWTMNNVFSFFRLFITNPEVFKSNSKLEKEKNIKPKSLKHKLSEYFPKFGVTYYTISIITVISQISWATSHDFDTIFVRIIIALAISFVLSLLLIQIYKGFKSLKKYLILNILDSRYYFYALFLGLYFYFASEYYFTGINEHLSLISLLFLIPLQFIGLVYFSNYRSKSNGLIYFLITFVFSVLIIIQFLSLLSVIESKEISLNILGLTITTIESTINSLANIGIYIVLIATYFYYKHLDINRNNMQISWYIYSLSMLYTFGLIFFWNPLIVYSSFPQNFDFPAIQFFTENFSDFAISILTSLFLFAISPKSIKKILQAIGFIIMLIVFIYSSVIPLDLGTLQVNFFSNEGRLAADIMYYIGEASLIIAIIMFSLWLLNSNYKRYIIGGIVLLNAILMVNSLYLSINTKVFFSKEPKQEIDNKFKNKIPFSKNEENVVYFIIDGAQAWYTDSIFNNDKSLKDMYNGFVWYPNTISTSNYTYASVPSMIAGPDYTIANMNLDKEHTIFEKITESTRLFYDKIKSKGYYFTGNSLKYSALSHSAIENYLPTWSHDWDKLMDNNIKNEMWYTRLWENALFSSVPLFIKPKIYNHNKWLVKNNIMNTNEVDKYNFVRLLPNISTINDNKKNFIYIHSMFNHVPWDYITDEGKFIRDVHPLKNQRWFMELFGKWIQWMKANDVYDNTKIILVSDHGASWWHYHGKIERNVPVKWDDEKKASMMEFLRVTPLLMVKDFNAKGELKYDWRFMCNNDVYDIAFNRENITTNQPIRKREIISFYTKWHNDLTKRKIYTNDKIFEVKDSVYYLKNWRMIPKDSL